MRGGASVRPSVAARAVAIVLLMAASAVPASAQQSRDLTELSLDLLMAAEVDTVYGASRFQQRIEDAPARVTVVTRDEIVAYGYRTVAEALRAVTGFYVSDDRNYSYAGLTGSTRPGDHGLQVLILVDGHRVNDNVRDFTLVGREFPIDLDLVERIEVIRGPAGSVYGARASAGVVNVVTRRGSGAGASAAIVAGNLGNAGGGVTYGTRTSGGLEVLLSASAQRGADHGELSHEAPGSIGSPGRVDVDATDDRHQRLFAGLSFGRFRLLGAHSLLKEPALQAGVAAASSLPFTATSDARSFLDLQYDRPTPAGMVAWRLYYDHYRAVGESVDRPRDGLASSLSRLRAYGEWWGGELRLLTPDRRAHRVGLGAEFVYNRRREREAELLDGQRRYSFSTARSMDWSLDAQDQWRVAGWFALNGSVRSDYREGFKRTTSPRLAAIFDVASGTTARVVYARIHRFPSVFERSGGSAPEPASGAELMPETADTWTLLGDQRLGSKLRASAGVTFARYSNLIGERYDAASGQVALQNMRHLTAKGLSLELEAKRRPQEAPVLRVSYARQSMDSSTVVPNHLLGVTAMPPLPVAGARAGLELQYVSRRTTAGGFPLDAYVLAHANVTRANLLPGLDLAVGVRNLFGARYAAPVDSDNADRVLYREGRTVTVRLTWRLK